jgi:hypothetical protein
MVQTSPFSFKGGVCLLKSRAQLDIYNIPKANWWGWERVIYPKSINHPIPIFLPDLVQDKVQDEALDTVAENIRKTFAWKLAQRKKAGTSKIPTLNTDSFLLSHLQRSLIQPTITQNEDTKWKISRPVSVAKDLATVINNSDISLNIRNIVKQLSNGHTLCMVKMCDLKSAKCSMCVKPTLGMFCSACTDQTRTLCLVCFDKKHDVRV